MAERTSKKQGKGKKGRKVGRNAKSPAHMRYKAEKRWMKHKVTRIAKMMRKHKNYKLPENFDPAYHHLVREKLA